MRHLLMLVTLSLLVLLPGIIAARQFNDLVVEGGEKADTVTSSKSSKMRFYTVGLNYGSNNTFFGRSTAEKRPYLSNDYTYTAKSGFWVSTTIFDLVNTNNFVDGADISGGWNYDFTKKIDGSVSYSKYFFRSESSMIQSATSNLLATHVGYDWYYLYSTLTLSSIFGGSNDVFVTFSNSRYFEKESLLSNKDYISIEPRFSIIAGTQNFAANYMTQQEKKAPVSAPGKGAPKPAAGGQETSPESSKFNIINYELRVPVTYSYGNTSIETTWCLVNPVNLVEGDQSKAQSVFTVSLFHVFKSK